MLHYRLFFRVAIACSLLSSWSKAQCTLDWAPGSGIPGVDGEVRAIVEWDPDGDGPKVPITVIGGDFRLAGSTSVSGIATWDGQAWSPLTIGSGGIVSALANDHGVLWAALEPTPTITAGSIYYPPAELYKFISGAWVKILTLTRLPNWSPNSPATVYQIVPTSNSMYINGFFDSIVTHDSSPNAVLDTPSRLARRTSSSWEPVAINTNSSASQLRWLEPDILTCRSNDRFYAITPSATYRIPPYYTYSIQPGPSFIWKNKFCYIDEEQTDNGYIYALYTLNDPHNLTTSTFDRTELPIKFYPPYFARDVVVNNDTIYILWSDLCISWDGTKAVTVPNFRGEPTAAAATSRGIVVASDSRNIGSGGHRIASFDPLSLNWSVMGSGFNALIRSSAIANGDIYVAGDFTRAGNVAANGIARLHGGEWQALGSGVTGTVDKLVELDGEILVCGKNLGNAGGVPNTGSFARWTGSEWKSIPGLAGSGFYDAMRYKDYVLVATSGGSGNSALYKFKWTEKILINYNYQYPDPAPMQRLLSIEGNQRVMVAPGRYLGFGEYALLQYSGVALDSMTLKGYWPWTLSTLLSDGRTIFDISNRTFWNGGTTWQPMNSVPQGISDICGLNGGGVLVGSWNNFLGTSKLLFRDQAGNISSIAAPPDGNIMSCANLNGKLAIGGEFTHAGSKVSAYFALLEPVDTSIQISTQPKDTQGCWSKLSQFSVAASSSKPLNFQWRRSGVPLVNGLTGTGSQIFGCTTSFLRIAPATNGKLTQFDAAVYDCVITTTCSTEITNGVRLGLAGADFNCNKLVDDADFASFSVAYNLMLCATAGMPLGCPADLNADGVVDDADFSLFVVQYDQFLVN